MLDGNNTTYSGIKWEVGTLFTYMQLGIKDYTASNHEVEP